MADEQKQLFNLDSVELSTVGLVPKGAVSVIDDEDGNPTGHNFIILKSEENSMPDNPELDIEEVQEETPVPDETLSKSDQGLLQQFLTFLKGHIAKANPAALAQAARILTAGGYPITAAKLGAMLGGNDEDEDVEMSGKAAKPKADKVAKSGTEETTEQGGKPPVTEPTETVVSKAIEDRLADIEKANLARIEAIEKALEEKYKGEVEALKTQAEEAKVEVAKANEAREQQVWIEKAGEMTFALGADQKELGKHLHVIARTAPAESVDYIVAVLKAADHTLTESNLFSEFGTSQVPEQVEAVQKAENIAKEKGISLADAMLELSAAEQAEIAKDFLGNVKEK